MPTYVFFHWIKHIQHVQNVKLLHYAIKKTIVKFIQISIGKHELRIHSNVCDFGILKKDF